jgi:hypothetical protein
MIAIVFWGVTMKVCLSLAAVLALLFGQPAAAVF